MLRSLIEIGEDCNVEVSAICDVDSEALSQRAAACEKLNGGKRVATVADMRRLLEDKSIDAIVHATPTHWHALGAIWTMQAGKDAYVEKPLALTLWEGGQIVEAAKSGLETGDALATLQQIVPRPVAGLQDLLERHQPSADPIVAHRQD